MDEQSAERRRAMVERHLVGRGIRDGRVLQAMGRVPRERFVPADLRARAYDDTTLPIAEGQSVSQPYMVAVMSEALLLQGTERVLEIGTGSGYGAAVLGALAAQVISVERHPVLAERAGAILRDLAITNVSVQIGDGSRGWPGSAPYDAIVVTAGAPDVPAGLVDQLAPGGRLVIPIGDRETQTLWRLINRNGALLREEITSCVFVPLIGAQGWRAPD
jgi:protein-L-isoaspartate(D-aspartate) O-methyltransferase